jgi:small subunit ribosomal protein S8e
MGISRDSRHKRRATGGRMPIHKKKRAFEKARPLANTRLHVGEARIRRIRTLGGNFKFRALRLNEGNFNWPSEGIAKKTKVLDVVYNASNNELVRTKTLVKNCIVQIDSSPFRTWYSQHYGVDLHTKKGGNFN